MAQRRQEIAAFIKSSFSSIWMLEVFLFLKAKPWAQMTKAEIVLELRASDTVVAQSVRSLVAAGLIIEDEGETFRYCPASIELTDLAAKTETLYQKQPDAVRRLIVLGANQSLAAFADAFKIRKD